MTRSVLQIKNDPYSAVSVSGKTNENFRVGELLILQSAQTGQTCKKIVQRVVDCDDGNCVLDIITVL
jgi:hypothetical protein